MSSEKTIKVVKSTEHGFEYVETITRKVRSSGHRDRYGNQQRQMHFVSYKGKQRQIFILPACYGDCIGACITAG